MRRFTIAAVLALTSLIGVEVSLAQPPPGQAKPPVPPADPAAGVTVTLEAPRRSMAGQPVDLRLRLRNARKEPLAAGLAIVLLPPGLTYLRSEPAGALLCSTVTWSTKEIPPESTLEIALDCRAGDPGPSRVTAVFSSESLRSPEGRQASLAAHVDLTVVGGAALHVSTYDTDDPVEIGTETTYVVEVRNEGTGPCTTVKLTCRIPPELTYVKAEGPVPFLGEGGTVGFEALPILMPGEKLTFKVTCRAAREGSARFAITLACDESTEPIEEEEETLLYR